jgi:hypothetical protein
MGESEWSVVHSDLCESPGDIDVMSYVDYMSRSGAGHDAESAGDFRPKVNDDE